MTKTIDTMNSKYGEKFLFLNSLFLLFSQMILPIILFFNIFQAQLHITYCLYVT